MNLYKEIEKNFPLLEKFFNDEELLKFKNTPLGNLYLYHFGFGTWIRNNLLPDDSLLCRLFKNNIIEHKDDMSAVIIRLFRYHLYIIDKHDA